MLKKNLENTKICIVHQKTILSSTVKQKPIFLIVPIYHIRNISI